MRNPSDLPPRTPRDGGGSGPRRADRGRIILIVVAVVVVGLILSARLLTGFFVDYLWHDSVDRGDVFWGVLGNKLFLLAMFGLVFVGIAFVNLLIADRLAPSAFSANMHPVVERFHEIFGKRLRLLRFGVAIVFAFLFALPATGYWREWILFRNSQSFGIEDAQFGNDIGFYVFRLPFIAFALDWMFAAVVFVTLLTLLTHVLNGGVVIAPPKPKVRRATKAHLAILLAILAVLKAADYWVTRYELTTERRGFVQGATYAVVNAQLPAVVLLALIALLVAGLFVSTLKTDSWRLPLVASGLWVVVALAGGVIYPAAIQALVVNPNQRDREAPYIERNVIATRQALGIGDVSEQVIEFGSLSADEIEQDIQPLQDVRLLNPGLLVPRFRTDQGQRAGLTIRDLDIDRYEVDGRVQQVVIAARELDLETIPNKSWQGRHLISTHGCGLIQAPVGRVGSNGRPDYQVLDLDRPELYFSQDLTGYAVVGTSVREERCAEQENEDAAYTGDGGVALDSPIKRFAFALTFLDYNLIGSSAVDNDSRLLWVRNIKERVEKVAPFLSFDADPYPVAVDGGVTWVIDGYTTSSRYPYAQNADRSQLTGNSGLDFDFNYIRNSVKATVDAYDGSITFYVIDESDPIIRAWRSAFPDMFRPISEMPETLVEHLRYPEDLFRVQTAAYSKYRLAPEVFFDRTGAWSVAQGPSNIPRSGAASQVVDEETGASSDFAADSTTARFVPYYSMFRAPGEDDATFQLFRPFVPFSTDDNRRELQAFMTASSDPDTYGQLQAYVLRTTNTDGPATVAATMESDITISEQLTLLDQTGSSVFYGDMQMVPVGDGVLYVRPLYVQSDAIAQPSYRYILASYDGEAAFGTSLQSALAKLFPGFRAEIGDVVGDQPSTPTDPGDPTTPTDPDDPDAPPSDETPAELLERAEVLFAEADAALAESPPDFTTYADKTAEARDLVQQALELLSAGG